MNFFKKIFGPADPVASVRRAQQQGRWADALVLGEAIDRSTVETAAQVELEQLLTAAGDALAQLNLSEGDACLRAGDLARAREHFQLAAAQARSEEFIFAAREKLDAPLLPECAAVSILVAPASQCSGHCGGAATTETGETAPLDMRTRLELTVAAYPPELAARYSRFDGPLLEGFLLAHDGQQAAALACLDQVPAGERDDLFHFERGALLARTGQIAEAVVDLEKALALNPTHLLALETLVDLEMKVDAARAERRLQRMLADRLVPAFAHGRLAILLAQRNHPEAALEQARLSLALEANPQTMLFAAGLLEQLGRPAEAEALLARLPAGGCGGSINLPLAEFWLRHRKNLDRALDSFTAALRQDGHPRWRLKIAQVYLARGWRKEARTLLEEVLAVPFPDPEIDRAAKALLSADESGSS